MAKRYALTSILSPDVDALTRAGWVMVGIHRGVRHGIRQIRWRDPLSTTGETYPQGKAVALQRKRNKLTPRRYN